MGKKEDEEKKDLTSIEDLGHYLHQLNPEIEKQLTHGKKEGPGHDEEPTTAPTEESTPPVEPTPEPSELAADEFLSEPINTAEAETIPESTSEEVNIATEEFKMEEPQTETTEFKTEEAPPTEAEFPAPEATQEVEASNVAEPAPVEETSQTPEVAPPESEKPVEPPPPEPEKSKAPEKFEEVREFGKNISTTTAATPGNPPFSIILKNIQFKEDAENIMIALKEYGIANASNENIFKQGLETGSILITQLSESTGILLVHKFRQYELEIEMGLSEEIRPHKTRDQKGLVHKESIFQNKNESADLKSSVVDPKSLLLSTTPTLENFIINRYIGIVSEHTLVEETELETTSWEEKYSFLADQLKNKAIKLRGNAIIGIAFQLSPLDASQYKITCTGNVVWVSPVDEKTI